MQLTTAGQRRATSMWLRTGRLPVFDEEDGIEVKFNPYHDVIGRFTFAPGGAAGTWRSGRLAPGPGRAGRGSNSRAFEDPMTLEHVAPGLRDAPAGAIVALADNLFDLHGIPDATQIDFMNRRATRLWPISKRSIRIIRSAIWDRLGRCRGIRTASTTSSCTGPPSTPV